MAQAKVVIGKFYWCREAGDDKYATVMRCAGLYDGGAVAVNSRGFAFALPIAISFCAKSSTLTCPMKHAKPLSFAER